VSAESEAGTVPPIVLLPKSLKSPPPRPPSSARPAHRRLRAQRDNGARLYMAARRMCARVIVLCVRMCMSTCKSAQAQ
jgi:hypothetical protein